MNLAVLLLGKHIYLPMFMPSDSEYPVCLLALQGDSGLLVLLTKPSKQLRESLGDRKATFTRYCMLGLQPRRDSSQMNLDLRSEIRNAHGIRICIL